MHQFSPTQFLYLLTSPESPVFPVSFLMHDARMAIPGHLDSPVSPLTGKRAEKVPVIRLYGYAPHSESPTQCCVNVHSYFPKFYVDDVGMDLHAFAELVDGKLGVVAVYNVRREFRTNFYGFHQAPIPVLLVELFRPIDVPRVAELLSSITNELRPFEVHIPFLLNFLADFGIQGVSPFYIDATQIEPSTPKSSSCGLEISIRASAIRTVRSSQTPNCPFPPPLSSDSQLVCEVLQTLWEEEFARLQPGEVFPYFPEGMADGLRRPDCSESALVVARRGLIAKWCEGARADAPPAEPQAELSEIPQTGLTTQGLATELAHLVGERPSIQTVIQSASERTEILTPVLQSVKTQIATPIQESATQILTPRPSGTMEPTVVMPSLVEVARLDRTDHTEPGEPQSNVTPVAAPVSARSQILPNNACLVRYSVAIPKISAQIRESQISLLGLTGTQREGPLRRPAPHAESAGTLTFGTVCVMDVLGGEGILAIVCELRAEWGFEEKIVFAQTNACENHACSFYSSEHALLSAFRDRVLLAFDPAVLVVWDSSLLTRLGERMHSLGIGTVGRSLLADDHGPAGRLVVDLWRVLRKDDALRLATTTLPGMAQSVLGVTIPAIADEELAKWMGMGKVSMAVEYLKLKTRTMHSLLETAAILPRATEMARLFGMDLESTFTRGSQFRVECMLVRAARKLGFILPSSTREQVKNQAPTVGLPLILEPVPGLVEKDDPICVFDFQSLYPSVMIGYNICYSTCLGKVSKPSAKVKLGTQEAGVTRTSTLVEASLCVPADMLYVQRCTRVGLLPRICHEILQTRIMVKKSIKHGSKSPALLRQLDARQLSLKLLSNVVYGYATASFTGRMPCSEIADSILLTARESLEATMRVAERLGGDVVYGDTDSLFVRLAGFSMEAAFGWGNAFVGEVSKIHPWPMKLVFEKVYSPCCLAAKKRYVGRAFDFFGASPRLDAKGIETIRRDTCPAVAVSLERIINNVFSGELSVEAAAVGEFTKILRGKIPLRFFIFQNQVREQYSGNLPPAARVAIESGRDLVRKERIAFVITQGAPGSKLGEQVHPPSVLLTLDERKRMRLNIDYYLVKQLVPAVQRTFGPIANKAHAWLATARGLCVGRKNDIEDIAPASSLVHTRTCVLCKSITASPLFASAENLPLFCAHCLAHREPQCIEALQVGKLESAASSIRKLCLHCCSGLDAGVERCRDAFHCSVYFEREINKLRLAKAYRTARSIQDPLSR